MRLNEDKTRYSHIQIKDKLEHVGIFCKNFTNLRGIECLHSVSSDVSGGGGDGGGGCVGAAAAAGAGGAGGAGRGGAVDSSGGG